MTTALADQFPGIHLFGQAVGSGATPAITVVIWVGILITALVCGGFAVMVLRRNLLSKDGPGGGGHGLTLDQLRGMHRRGELSEQEYETARAALTSSLTGRPPPPVTRAPRVPEKATDGTLVAPPGFDLTGQPLPRPGGAPPLPRSGDGNRGGQGPRQGGGGT